MPVYVNDTKITHITNHGADYYSWDKLSDSQIQEAVSKGYLTSSTYTGTWQGGTGIYTWTEYQSKNSSYRIASQGTPFNAAVIERYTFHQGEIITVKVGAETDSTDYSNYVYAKRTFHTHKSWTPVWGEFSVSVNKPLPFNVRFHYVTKTGAVDGYVTLSKGRTSCSAGFNISLMYWVDVWAQSYYGNSQISWQADIESSDHTLY